MSNFKQDITDNSFKANDMTPENIASAFNHIDYELKSIKKSIETSESRTQEKINSMMKDVKIWILGGLLAALVSGGLLSYVAANFVPRVQQPQATSQNSISRSSYNT